MTFTGRGCLVVVAPHLLSQWAADAKALCVAKQRVVVVDEAATRRHVLSSLDGMRMCVSRTLLTGLACTNLCSTSMAEVASGASV